MADAPPTTPEAPAPAPKPTTDGAASEIKASEVAIIAGIGFATVVAAYFVLCRYYYIDKLGSPSLAWERAKDIFFFSFATFAVLGTAAVAGAVLYPRIVAHALTTVFGLTYLVSGVQSFFGPLPALATAVQLALGGGLLALTWVSYQKKDRAAWSFLMSICVVLCLVHLFGAPRVRTAMKVELWYALTACALQLGAIVGFYRMRRDVV